MSHVTVADGLDLHVEEAGPADAPAVVLSAAPAPTTAGGRRRWRPTVKSSRVVAFDNRGVGRSSTPPGPYTVADMAGDTVRLLDELGLEGVHLSGSSLGGAIALYIAVHEPSRVLSLQMHSSWLATAGYTAFSLGLLKQILERGGTDFYYEATLPLLFSARFLSTDHDRLTTILANIRANTATYEGLHGQIEANLTHDLAARAAEVAVPTLVTVGELDVLVPLAASEELAAAIPGAELVVFEGAGHLASIESADRFNWAKTGPYGPVFADRLVVTASRSARTRPSPAPPGARAGHRAPSAGRGARGRARSAGVPRRRRCRRDGWPSTRPCPPGWFAPPPAAGRHGRSRRLASRARPRPRTRVPRSASSRLSTAASTASAMVPG